jgi:phage terminase large subunit-like protein
MNGIPTVNKKKYPHTYAAWKYGEDVLSGKIPACKWVKLACQRQLDDLKKKDWPFVFDFDRAERVCNFIERLPHVKGKWARGGERIKLEPWQKFGLTTIFGWVKADGLRRFREVYWEIPRKNAKSTIASGVGLYLFAADKEFGAEVYSGATTEKQAWEVFRPAKQMVDRTPGLKEHFGIESNAKNLCIMTDGARFEPVIGKPGDGSSPSCAIVDEYHEHDTDAMYETMLTGMDAREQPLMFAITTAGVNLSGPCYSKRDYLCKILEGAYNDERQFGIIYTCDEDDDWTTVNSLKKANPNFGVSIIEDNILAAHHSAMQNVRLQNTFKTKRLNIWCGARNAWMNMQQWAKCPERKTLEELKGRPVFVALDLASKIDIAAKVMIFPPHGDDKLWHLHGKYYLPEDKIDEGGPNASHYATWAKMGHITLTPGGVTDFEYIIDDLKDDRSAFEIQEVPYDPFQATYLATTLIGEGFPMVEMGATVKNFSEPMKEFQALVVDRLMAHGDCPVMNWMMSNVVARADKKDNIFPNKEFDENKIDGPVAAIMAIGRAKVHTEGASFWE